MVVDVFEPSGLNIDDFLEVRLSRLRADGSVDDVFVGQDLTVPIGQYRVEAFIGNNQHSSLTVYLHQPEVRLGLGVSLLNCCMDIPNTSYLGSIHVTLRASGDPSEYEVRLLPVWHNNLTIGATLGQDWSTVFGPIDLGEYVVVALRDKSVVATGNVVIAEEKLEASIELSVSQPAGQVKRETEGQP